MRFKKNVIVKILFIIVALILIRFYGLSYIFDSAENGYSLFDNVADSLNSEKYTLICLLQAKKLSPPFAL